MPAVLQIARRRCPASRIIDDNAFRSFDGKPYSLAGSKLPLPHNALIAEKLIESKCKFNELFSNVDNVSLYKYIYIYIDVCVCVDVYGEFAARTGYGPRNQLLRRATSNVIIGFCSA